jgi:hypothetical protein
VSTRWLFALALMTHVTNAWATPVPLSPDQQRRLDAGEIVLLDARPPGASESSQGGTAVALVCAPVSVVWDILVDWGNHPAIYSHVKRAEVRHVEASRVRVHYTLSVWPLSVGIDVDTYPDEARHHIDWRLAEDQPSRFFAENTGYWQIEDAGADSRVTYAVATRTIVPGILMRYSHRDSLVSTVEAVRKQAARDSPSACPHFAR